jgi:hypothetical protein
MQMSATMTNEMRFNDKHEISCANHINTRVLLQENVMRVAVRHAVDLALTHCEPFLFVVKASRMRHDRALRVARVAVWDSLTIQCRQKSWLFAR